MHFKRRKVGKTGYGGKFWNKEYNNKTGNNLAISNNPSGDLLDFIKWLSKNYPESLPSKESFIYDIGCGNGRNLIYLFKEFGAHGYGFDISESAIKEAKQSANTDDLQFEVKKMSGTIDMPDNSVDFILDMMASHFLDKENRKQLRQEIVRVLKPGGWLFYKTFLLDGDINAKRMLRDYPAKEEGSYIHPKMGVLEHVSTEAELRQQCQNQHKLNLYKFIKSHKHLRNGRAYKRRSAVLYCRKEV